jgi:hypothetical protein
VIFRCISQFVKCVACTHPTLGLPHNYRQICIAESPWATMASWVVQGSLQSVAPLLSACHTHSFLPSYSAKSHIRRRFNVHQRRSKHTVCAGVVSSSLFSDVLVPVATLAAPVLEPLSATAREAFRVSIAGSPLALKPVLTLMGSDILSVLELQPSSATVLRAAVSACLSHMYPALRILRTRLAVIQLRHSFTFS